MIDIKSPVADNFSLLDYDLQLNTFIPLGNGKRGTYHVAIFFKSTIDWAGLSLEESVFSYSSECRQFIVSSVEGTIIGSVFEVSKRKLDFSNEVLKVITPTNIGDFKKFSDIDVSGAIVFHDASSNLIIVPANFNPNEFAVLP